MWRYVREAVDLREQHAPSLTAALWRLAHNGHALGILDGTLVATDRLGAESSLLLRQAPPARGGPAGAGRSHTGVSWCGSRRGYPVPPTT